MCKFHFGETCLTHCLGQFVTLMDAHIVKTGEASVHAFHVRSWAPLCGVPCACRRLSTEQTGDIFF
jgi:hypothetical protein